MKEDAIFLRGIYLQFDNNPIFSNLNFKIPISRWTGLLGPSGIGKTTFLNLLANIIPNEKNIFYRGKITYQDLPVHPHIAYLSQRDLLFPWLNAYENATLLLRLKKHTATQKKNIHSQAKLLFEKMHLQKAMPQMPHQLSGGMRQRIALIRILLENKPIILLDEPFCSLDAITRFQLQTLFSEFLEHKTVVFITHDPFEALRLADDIYLMMGSPVTLHHLVQFKTAKPRNIDDPEIMQLYTKLIEQLSIAKDTIL